MARRRKPVKKRRGKGSTDSSSSINNSVSSEHMEIENSPVAAEDIDLMNCTVDAEAMLRRNKGGSEKVDGEEDREEGLRLPEMKDSSMDTVGQPLCDVMDRLNGALDKEEAWGHTEEAGVKGKESFNNGTEPPAQQPFREDSQSEPPDRFPGEETVSPVSPNSDFLQASPASTDVRRFTPFSPDFTSSGGGHNDSAEHGQSQTPSGGLKGAGEAKAAEGQESDLKDWEQDTEVAQETEQKILTDEEKETQEVKLSPSESSHPAEFR